MLTFSCRRCMRMRTDTAKEQIGQSFTLLPVPLRGTTPLLAQALVLHKHLDTQLCVSLIRDAERCSEFRGGWRTKRHNSYPSTDLDVSMIFRPMSRFTC